jgi:multidrug resistance efflux pump
LKRIQDLHRKELVSHRDLEKAESEASMRRAAMAALETAARHIPQEQITRDGERQVRLERLQGEIAALESQQENLKAESKRLDYEIERRRIRAPVDGRIGEAASLRSGAVVDEGEKLGSVIPAGRLLVVAQYPAEAAFGRIRVGQKATLRLTGFPWAEYGTVTATVSRVAQEIRNGKVRVELDVNEKSSYRGRLEHGMPGSIEVAVESLSPLSLVLRTAGQWLAAPL